MKADRYDVVYIIAQLYHEKGNTVNAKEEQLIFEVEGNAKMLGVDNGWVRSTQDYQTNKVATHNGKALLVLQFLQGKIRCGSG